MSNIVKKSSSTRITRTTSRRKMQTKIQQEIAKIDEEIYKLGLPENPKFLCTSAVSFAAFYPGNNTINITGLTDWRQCVMLYSFYNRMYNDIIAEAKSMFNEDINKLGIIAFPGSTQSYPNVLHDLKLRAKLVYHQERLSVLNAAKAKLTPFMDEESRLYSTLKEVEALYKTLK